MKSLKTAIFRPSPTAWYQKDINRISGGYHELSPLVSAAVASRFFYRNNHWNTQSKIICLARLKLIVFKLCNTNNHWNSQTLLEKLWNYSILLAIGPVDVTGLLSFSLSWENATTTLTSTQLMCCEHALKAIAHYPVSINKLQTGKKKKCNSIKRVVWGAELSAG